MKSMCHWLKYINEGIFTLKTKVDNVTRFSQLYCKKSNNLNMENYIGLLVSIGILFVTIKCIIYNLYKGGFRMQVTETRRARIEKVVDQLSNRLIDISHQIHARPEIGNEEFFASRTLMDLLEDFDFKIERNISNYDTGFIATYAAEKDGPTIAYLAEYDALSGLGHACGHNMIGTISCAAGIALKQVIDESGGTVKIYGTTAEEGGVNGSAKAAYVKDGYFNGIDAALMVHPGPDSYDTIPTLAVDVFEVEFFGKPAHASENSHDGINALDAMLQFYNGINTYRQQMLDTDRVHGIILEGGQAPNIIPEYTKARFFTRARSRHHLNDLTRRIKAIAEGAALQTGARMQFNFIQNGVDDFYINQKLDAVFRSFAESLGEKFSDDDFGFGATDTGNVSQVVPTIHPHIKIGSSTLIGHTKAFCEAAVSKKADEAIILSAKALALTGLALLEDEALLNNIKLQHKEVVE